MSRNTVNIIFNFKFSVIYAFIKQKNKCFIYVKSLDLNRPSVTHHCSSYYHIFYIFMEKSFVNSLVYSRCRFLWNLLDFSPNQLSTYPQINYLSLILYIRYILKSLIPYALHPFDILFSPTRCFCSYYTYFSIFFT